MWLNIIVASSNLIGLIGVLNYYNKGLLLECFCIMFSIVSSCIYHLAESIKHNMDGIGYCTNNKTQKLLLNMDRIGAVLASVITLRIIIYHQILLDQIILISLFGVLGEIIPEIISGLYTSGNHESVIPKSITLYLNPNGYKMNQTIEHIIYVSCHCIWHIAMFQISNIVSLYKN